MGKKKLVYPIPEACRKCKYYSLSIECCDYISVTGHSRTFDNNGRQVRYIFNGADYCDKYEEGNCKKKQQCSWKEGGFGATI